MKRSLNGAHGRYRGSVVGRRGQLGLGVSLSEWRSNPCNLASSDPADAMGLSASPLSQVCLL